MASHYLKFCNFRYGAMAGDESVPYPRDNGDTLCEFTVGNSFDVLPNYAYADFTSLGNDWLRSADGYANSIDKYILHDWEAGGEEDTKANFFSKHRCAYGGGPYVSGTEYVPQYKVKWRDLELIRQEEEEEPYIFGVKRNYTEAEGTNGSQPNAWVIGTLYTSGWYVRSRIAPLNIYVCIAEHTSDAIREPEVGANWATAWSLVNIREDSQDTVYQNGETYVIPPTYSGASFPYRCFMNLLNPIVRIYCARWIVKRAQYYSTSKVFADNIMMSSRIVNDNAHWISTGTALAQSTIYNSQLIAVLEAAKAYALTLSPPITLEIIANGIMTNNTYIINLYDDIIANHINCIDGVCNEQANARTSNGQVKDLTRYSAWNASLAAAGKKVIHLWSDGVSFDDNDDNFQRGLWLWTHLAAASTTYISLSSASAGKASYSIPNIDHAIFDQPLGAPSGAMVATPIGGGFYNFSRVYAEGSISWNSNTLVESATFTPAIPPEPPDSGRRKVIIRKTS